MFLKPVQLPVETFHQVLRLACAGQVMVLTRKNHQFCVYTIMPQCPEPLLTLFDRHTEVVIGMQNQRGSLHVLRILQRRCIPVLIEIVEQEPPEILLVPVSAIARAIIADEIRQTPQRDGCLEPVRMSDDPVRHEPAVTAAGNAHPARIDPWILPDGRIHARHHIRVIHHTPVVHDAALELLPVSRRSAWIAEEHRPSFGCIDLKLVIPIDAVLSGRATMNTQYHRIFNTGLPAHGLHHKPVDTQAIGALIRQALYRSQVQAFPQCGIEVRQLPFAPAGGIRNIQIVQMLEVVGEIDHPAAALVPVERPHTAFPGDDFGNLARRKIHAEYMRRALHPGTESEFSGPRAPGKFARNQIEVIHSGLRCTARRWCDVKPRRFPPFRLARECNLFPIGRPARLRVVILMIGNFRQRAAFRRDHPDIFVVPAIVLLACPVRDKSDEPAIRRPLRIRIVPVFARSQLSGVAPEGICFDPADGLEVHEFIEGYRACTTGDFSSPKIQSVIMHGCTGHGLP